MMEGKDAIDEIMEGYIFASPYVSVHARGCSCDQQLLTLNLAFLAADTFTAVRQSKQCSDCCVSKACF